MRPVCWLRSQAPIVWVEMGPPPIYIVYCAEVVTAQAPQARLSLVEQN